VFFTHSGRTNQKHSFKDMLGAHQNSLGAFLCMLIYSMLIARFYCNDAIVAAA
jgi:hypothetical protein